MGLTEKWNKFAKKKIYINDSWEMRMGRLVFMVVLNLFIMFGMILSGGTAEVIMWLWVDMIASFENKNKIMQPPNN